MSKATLVCDTNSAILGQSTTMELSQLKIQCCRKAIALKQPRTSLSGRIVLQRSSTGLPPSRPVTNGDVTFSHFLESDVVR